MKLSAYFLLFVLFTTSCIDEVKLYHPEEKPEIKWFLETVDYPETNPGFTSRLDQTFYYTDDDYVTKISNPSKTDSLLRIDYKPNKIALSKLRDYGTSITYDSIILKLNDKNQTIYALHTTCTQSTGKEKIKETDDSTTFVYDAAGYMIELNRFSRTGGSSLSHSQKHTITDGNITQIDVTSGNTLYKYIYQYDDKEHTIPAEYCYEMPYNTSQPSGCWLFTNMPFLTDYFGKRSKNNIVRMSAEKITNGKPDPYGDISYEYTFDENNLVTEVEMSGTTRNNTQFENFITRFSYFQKEYYK